MSPVLLYALVALNGGSPMVTTGLTLAECNSHRTQSDKCFAYMSKTEGATLYLRPTRGGNRDTWQSVVISPENPPPMVKWETRWDKQPELVISNPLQRCEALKAALDPSTPAVCAPIIMPFEFCAS
jgi:hypothetical protein